MLLDSFLYFSLSLLHIHCSSVDCIQKDSVHSHSLCKLALVIPVLCRHHVLFAAQKIFLALIVERLELPYLLVFLLQGIFETVDLAKPQLLLFTERADDARRLNPLRRIVMPDQLITICLLAALFLLACTL